MKRNWKKFPCGRIYHFLFCYPLLRLIIHDFYLYDLMVLIFLTHKKKKENKIGFSMSAGDNFNATKCKYMYLR